MLYAFYLILTVWFHKLFFLNKPQTVLVYPKWGCISNEIIISSTKTFEDAGSGEQRSKVLLKKASSRSNDFYKGQMPIETRK